MASTATVELHHFPGHYPDEVVTAVSALELADHLSGRDVECSEQGRRSMAHVVVGARLRKTVGHRQHGLRPVEGLDLGLLVDTEHERLIRWSKIETDDIAHLLDEVRIVGELERPAEVGLQAEGPPDTVDEVRGLVEFLREEPDAPVRRVLRLLEKPARSPRRDLFVTVATRLPRTRRIREPTEPVLEEAVPPLGDGLLRDTVPAGDLLSRKAIRAVEDDPGAKMQAVRRLASAAPRLERVPLYRIQFDGCGSSSHARRSRGDPEHKTASDSDSSIN